MDGGQRRVPNNLTFYFGKMEAFYIDLANVAKKHGYMLDLVKEEAYPVSEDGDRISNEDLREIWGDDVPSWKWYYDYFFEGRDPADYDLIVDDLRERGYQIDYTNRCNYSGIDLRTIDITMFRGEVVLRLHAKWFAFGECTNLSVQRLFHSFVPGRKLKSTLSSKAETYRPSPSGLEAICVDKLWKPLRVIRYLGKLERKLCYRQMLATVYVNCIDCGKRLPESIAQYCIECDKPVCTDCIVCCHDCYEPLCQECGYFGFCHDCNGSVQTH